MKVGFVVEGSDRSAGDVFAIRELCIRLASVHGVTRVPEVLAGGSKKELKEKAHDHLSSLRELGCERIIFVWDNSPPWTLDVAELDHDVAEWEQGIRDVIIDNDESLDGVELVCARQEVEAWFLADGTAIRQVLKSIRNKSGINIKTVKIPESVMKPKRHFIWKYWDDHFGRQPYGTEYRLLANHVGLEALRSCPSFVRFEAAVVAP
ncbi:MAG: DUF4276 family protein [Armatimonadetes bacterium]|nr:DUF4276 family protein [Armatimonadota bacterium]